MARSLKVLALLGCVFAASCTPSSPNRGEASQAIIECNGASVGLACDTDDDPCTIETCVLVGQDVSCELESLAGDGTPCVSDGNPCTADTCQAGLCTNTALPTDTLCDDGLFCTTGSTCDEAGICGGGTPACDDGDACTIDSCDEDADTCASAPAPVGSDCDDGDACTENESCDALGACVGATPVDCDDGSDCTSDTCDENLGCVNTPQEDSPCSDTFFCTIGETCTEDGVCEGEANCQDNNPCTIDVCDEVGNICSNAVDEGAVCNDNNACTENESCSLAGDCVGTPVDNGTICDNAGGCIAGGTCDDGACVGGTPLPDNTGCDDGDLCTISDVCTSGACSGYPRDCSDGDPCTADGCDAVTGCFNLPIEGCQVGPDAGPVDDAGPFEDGGMPNLDAGPVGEDAGPTGILGGGGCSAASGAAPPASVVFLVLLLWLPAGLRRRRRKKAEVALLSACVLAAVLGDAQRTAQAQGFDTEIFKPGISETSYLSQESPDVLPAWVINASASLSIASDPLVLRDPDTGDAVMNGVVVSNRTAAYLTAGVGLFGKLEVGIALPLVLSQSGDGSLIDNNPDLNSASLGDVRLRAKAKLYSKGNMHLGAALAATLPAGDSEALYGEQGLSTTPSLVVGWKRGRASVAVNLGVHIREAITAHDLAIGDELIAGIGAQVEAFHDKLWLVGEAYSRSALSDPTAERSPAEALLGVRAAAWGPYQVQAGVGAGIGRGYGSPAIRGLLGVLYRPAKKTPYIPVHTPEPKSKPKPEPPKPPEPEDKDTDGDGILDTQDRCPEAAEDKDDFEDEDGCPDDDNDGDGIADADDACPLRAEIINGINDEDGCPDEGIITMVQDRVVLGEKVLFDKNRARVKRKGRKALKAIITLYLQHPEWGPMSVEGHADTRGPSDFNMSLSRRRADRVRHEMIDLGMPADRISSKGFGETVPLVKGDSEEAMQTNRRVEFVILKPREEVQERILAPGETSPETGAPAEAEAAP